MAAPLTLLLVARQVDLSVGSAVALAATTLAVVAEAGYGMAAAVLAAMAAAMLVSVVNAIAITKFRVNSIIATLGTLVAFRGLAKLEGSGRNIRVDDFDLLGRARIDILGLQVPLAVLILLAVLAIFWVLMSQTRYGRHMYGMGANPKAALLAGIRLERNVVVGFLLTGLVVGLASLIAVSEIGAVAPTTGQGLELLAITGIILGGASLSGGRGTIPGDHRRDPDPCRPGQRADPVAGHVVLAGGRARHDPHRGRGPRPGASRPGQGRRAVRAVIDQPLLSVQHLSKNYGAVEALKDVSFELRRGEVVGLVGDNGAGKSTLVKCVAGVLTPSSGEIHLEGTQHEFGSPADALAAGVETVYQDLALVEMFDMTDNLFLGRELVRGGVLKPFGFLRKREMAKAARHAVAQLPARFPDLDAPIDTMSGGQRQVVAISKASFWGRRLLLLDEPTAALGVQESAGVLEMVTHAAVPRRHGDPRHRAQPRAHLLGLHPGPRHAPRLTRGRCERQGHDGRGRRRLHHGRPLASRQVSRAGRAGTWSRSHATLRSTIASSSTSTGPSDASSTHTGPSNPASARIAMSPSRSATPSPRAVQTGPPQTVGSPASWSLSWTSSVCGASARVPSVMSSPTRMRLTLSRRHAERRPVADPLDEGQDVLDAQVAVVLDGRAGRRARPA